MKTLINGKDYRNGRIDIEIKINELKENFNGMSIEINKKKKLQQLEQVANLSTYPSQHFNSFCYDDDDDDDDEEYTIAITPVLPTEEPDNSLSMGDEHLSTIPETESDELIKSSVENLVPILSESEDFSDIKNDQESFSDEDQSLLNRDTSIFSSPKLILFSRVRLPDTRILTTKVVDDISDNSTRELYVHVPNVLPTLPTISPMFENLFPFSSENKNKVFNSSILASNEEKSPHLLSASFTFLGSIVDIKQKKLLWFWACDLRVLWLRFPMTFSNGWFLDSLMLTISSISKVSSTMSFSRFFFSVTLIASSSSKSSSTKGGVLEGGGVSSNVTLSDSPTFLVTDIKTDKTEHENGKSVKNQSQSQSQ
ncbi:hypothetical protein Tco_0784061 [Tanacetum coccineum]